MSNQNLTPRLNRNEPNIIIDGGHEIWPQGTSISVGNNTNAYGSVLIQCINLSTGITLTNSQQTSIPTGTNLSYSNQMSKTAAGTLAAGTAAFFNYYVEGYDTSKIMNDSFTVLFWVKSSVASNRSLALRNTTSSHSYVKQYNIAATNTWQLQAVTFPALNTCPGTIDKTNGAGLQIAWNVVSGSTNQTATLNAWQGGNFISATGEDTTWLTGTTHDFSIAGVMVLPGDWSSLTSNTSAYRFLRAGRNFQEELSMSQRYFYALGIVDSYHFAIAYLQSATNWQCSYTNPVTMRSNPSVTTSGSTFPANWGGGGGTTTMSSYESTVKSISLQGNTSSSLTTGQALHVGANTTNYVLVSSRF